MDELVLAVPALAIGLLGPLGATVADFHFMLRDPDRLHSEEYLIERQRLVLEAKGLAGREDVTMLPSSGDPRIGSAAPAADRRREGT